MRLVVSSSFPYLDALRAAAGLDVSVADAVVGVDTATPFLPETTLTAADGIFPLHYLPFPEPPEVEDVPYFVRKIIAADARCNRDAEAALRAELLAGYWLNMAKVARRPDGKRLIHYRDWRKKFIKIYFSFFDQTD